MNRTQPFDLESNALPLRHGSYTIMLLCQMAYIAWSMNHVHQNEDYDHNTYAMNLTESNTQPFDLESNGLPSILLMPYNIRCLEDNTRYHGSYTTILFMPCNIRCLEDKSYTLPLRHGSYFLLAINVYSPWGTNYVHEYEEHDKTIP